MTKYTVQDHEPDYEPETIEASSSRQAAIKYARSVYDQEGDDVTVDCDVTDENGKVDTYSVSFRLEINCEKVG